MANTVQITFPYNGDSYTAEVQRVDGSLYIFFPDASLHQIIPSGKVAIDLKQGLQLNGDAITEEQDLILSVLGALPDENREYPPSSRKP